MFKPLQIFSFVLFFCSLPVVTYSQLTQKGADIYGQASQDLFGSSIAMSADGFVIATGAPEHSTVNGEVGMVRVHEWNGTAWVQRGQDLVGDIEWNKFGKSVSLSADGSILAVGGPGIPSISTIADGTEGTARVYQWDGNSWNQMGSTLSYHPAYQLFGWCVELSDAGGLLAVSTIKTGPGEIRIFAWDGNDWVQYGSEIFGHVSGTQIGASMAFSPDGNMITAGGPQNNGTTTAGGVYTFSWDGNAWVESADPILGDVSGDEFGNAISMTYGLDTLIAVGASRNDDGGNNAGKVVVYKRNGTSWFQYGSALLGNANNDWFGTSVAISNSGTRLAIGGPKHAGNGLSSGHVQIYDWFGNDWQLIQEIDGGAPNDEFGTAVGMNSTGEIIACGAPYKDVSWANMGQVRVYEDGIQGLTSLNSAAIRVYPNPAKDVIYIEGLEGEKVQFSIVDLSGRIVMEGTLNSPSIDVSELTFGVYTLLLEADEEISSTILVKN